MTTSTTIIDSTKRLVIKLTGTTDETRVLKVDPGSLSNALNANGQIITGTDRKSTYRMALRRVDYAVQSGSVILETDGDAGNTIVTLSGSNVLDMVGASEPYSIQTGAHANSTGNVYLTTVGFANTAYTVIADFRKHPEDFDQGQTADPTAFNA